MSRPRSTDPVPSSSSSEPLVDRHIAHTVDETLSSDRLAQTKAAVLLADKHGDLQYLGANSLPSIAFEAESIAQQKFRLKLSTLSGRNRTEANNLLRRLNGLKTSVSSVFPQDDDLKASKGQWWFPGREESMELSGSEHVHSYDRRAIIGVEDSKSCFSNRIFRSCQQAVPSLPPRTIFAKG